MITRVATALWLILAALIPIIAAQSEANCTDTQYNWMFNSVGLSPCHVAEQLVEPCSPQGIIIPSLPAGDEYFGPLTSQNNTCICTSIYYSLLSACGACQAGSWVSWQRFTTNCTSVWLTVYPNPIPASVKVPHWAYLDVSIAGTFNVLTAENAGGPESTSPAGATSISSTSSSTPTSSAASSSQSSSSAGPIAGGVVGGVVGVALIAGIVIFFYRRGGQHRSDRSRSIMSGPDVLSTSPPITVWHGSPLVPALRPQKLYDPQDPSTFPQYMHSNPPPMPDSLTGTTYTTTRQETHQPNRSATYYKGIPEVYD
ncbi:hypothetical protein M378DRAFT_8165 [Amanita muscaria Koide BX008]|uniref:Transmembrane protein n=1 Tax=Amanita muscaria (strain Koide BX008) TaxID=946122 RepID=A0A0C2XGY6_AMAMK|nr:hypothetical protein M378DRAFT_8165 [Amanita muscaria Koide BX008]